MALVRVRRHLAGSGAARSPVDTVRSPLHSVVLRAGMGVVLTWAGAVLLAWADIICRIVLGVYLTHGHRL